MPWSSSTGDATRSTARFTDARNWVGLSSAARSNTWASTAVTEARVSHHIRRRKPQADERNKTTTDVVM